jgi:hypothetical protein
MKTHKLTRRLENQDIPVRFRVLMLGGGGGGGRSLKSCLVEEAYRCLHRHGNSMYLGRGCPTRGVLHYIMRHRGRIYKIHPRCKKGILI